MDRLTQFSHDLISPARSLLGRGVATAPSTLHHILGETLRYLRWTLEYETRLSLLGPGPAAIMPRQDLLWRCDLNVLRRRILPRRRRRLRKVLSQDQLDQCRSWIMEAYAFDPALQVRNRAIFEVLWDGAIRKGALLGLRTENIHWQERLLLLSFAPDDYAQAWLNKQPNERTSKTGEYTVVVADTTIQWLDRYRQQGRPIAALRRNHGIFFCMHTESKDGLPLTGEALRHLFYSMSRPVDEGGAGVRVHPHLLRHTWATMALEDGLALESIQYQLGHAHLGTTMTYLHEAPTRVREELRVWRLEHPERLGGAI